MRLRSRLLVVLAVLCGCERAPAPPPIAAVTPATPSIPATPPMPSVPPATEATSGADGGAAPSISWAPPTAVTKRELPFEFAERFPAESQIELGTWLTDHHVVGRPSETECWELAAGVPPSPGLLCLATTGDHVRSRTTARLHLVRDGRLRVAWSAIVAAWANWLELVPVVSDDGQTLDLVDEPYRCRGAIAEARGKLGSGAHGPEFPALLEQACAARGRYVFRADRYLLEGGPKPLEDLLDRPPPF